MIQFASSSRRYRRFLMVGVVGAAFSALAPTLALAAEANSNSSTLEEIVVTARKRSESIQDVPLSVSAFSGDSLVKAGYSDLSNIARVAPGLYFEAPDRSRPLI